MPPRRAAKPARKAAKPAPALRGWPEKPRAVKLGSGAAIDRGVLLGYPSGRPVKDPALTIGPRARLRAGTVLYAGSRIGAELETGHGTVIREECTLGDRVRVWSGAYIDYGCEVGDDVKVHVNCYVAQRSVLGARCFLAPGVVLANDLYPGRERSRVLMTGPRIGPDAQVGCNVTILPFVRVGARTVVGAGSVVVKDLPEGVVAVGNPAKPIRKVAELSEAEVEERLAARLRSWEAP